MPTYHFRGYNREGKTVTGKRLSQSADSLSVQLTKEGVTPIVISPIYENLHNIAYWFAKLNGQPISVEELAVFARQMHTLCKTGVTITSSLRQLADNARTLQMTTALNGIVERLESGQDLASAMQEYPKIFKPIMISMIRVGQSTGHLDEAFLHLNEYLELEAFALKRTKAALRYPTFIFVTMIVAVVLVNILVIPTFARIFAQANVKLPVVTQLLINISFFFTRNWFLLLVILGFAVVGIYLYLQSPEGKLKWHRYQLKIPIVGSILKRIILLRFAQAFSIVVDSGIPILDGITLVAGSITNKYAVEEILSIREAVQHGKSLTQAVSATQLFTPLELQMLSVSEETGQLADMLKQVANYYRREVEYDLKRLNDVIEPVLIIGISMIVLLLAFAVYLPIWNMVKLVHAS